MAIKNVEKPFIRNSENVEFFIGEELRVTVAKIQEKAKTRLSNLSMEEWKKEGHSSCGTKTCLLQHLDLH